MLVTVAGSGSSSHSGCRPNNRLPALAHSSPPSSGGASNLIRSSMRRMVRAASVANCNSKQDSEQRTTQSQCDKLRKQTATQVHNLLSCTAGLHRHICMQDVETCSALPHLGRFAPGSAAPGTVHHQTGDSTACLPAWQNAPTLQAHCLAFEADRICTHLDHLGLAECRLQHTRVHVVDHLHTAAKAHHRHRATCCRKAAPIAVAKTTRHTGAKQPHSLSKAAQRRATLATSSLNSPGKHSLIQSDDLLG